LAVSCATLQEVRWLCARAIDLAAATPAVRAVIAPYIPRLLVSLFSEAGILALGVDLGAAKALASAATVVLPEPSQWVDGGVTSVVVGSTVVPLTWLAAGPERAWVTSEGGGSQPVRRVAAPGTSAVRAVTPENGRVPRAGGGVVRARVSDPRRPVAQR
jgi:hypothetical protein